MKSLNTKPGPWKKGDAPAQPPLPSPASGLRHGIGREPHKLLLSPRRSPLRLCWCAHSPRTSSSTRGKAEYVRLRCHAKIRCFTSTINNVGNSAARFASVVGTLTGQTELDRLTMLPWKSVLPSQLLTRGVAAWCPRCLTTWRDNGRTVYMPLLWALEVVKYCPDHRSPLQSVCSNCGRPQPLLGQCCPVGHCSHCKSWLGAEAKPHQSAPIRCFLLNRLTGRYGSHIRSKTSSEPGSILPICSPGSSYPISSGPQLTSRVSPPFVGCSGFALHPWSSGGSGGSCPCFPSILELRAR